MSNKIFFEIHKGGLFNQLMSIEIGFGIQQVSQKDVIFYYNDNNSKTSQMIYSHPFDNNDKLFYSNIFPNIFDLLSEKNTNNLLFISQKEFLDQDKNMIKINKLSDYYFSNNNYSPLELKFAGKRKKIDLTSDLPISITHTLAQYCSFFFKRSIDLDLLFYNIKFKNEYYEIAHRIAKSLGSFNGGHIRLTDNAHLRATSENVSSGIDSINNGLPFIMCTDEPSNDIIVKNNKKFILLNEYIINNFKKDFYQLEFNDSVSFALVCNLVMHYCQNFIGSFASTYTSYIQRNLNQKGLLKEWNFWGENKYIPNDIFSWNGHYDEQNSCWYRDWPESFLNVNTFPSTL